MGNGLLLCEKLISVIAVTEVENEIGEGCRILLDKEILSFHCTC